MDPAVVIGTVAAVVTAVSNFPQAVKTYKTRDTDDLTYGMLLLLMLGLGLWVCYGFMRGDALIVVSNACSEAMISYIFCVKALGGHRTAPKADLAE